MKQSYVAGKKDNTIVDDNGEIIPQAYYTSNSESISIKLNK